MAGRDAPIDRRLATYGTLSPGRANHGQLAGLGGRWLRGTVRGRLREGGRGSALGYPGIVLDPAAPAVCVHMLESADLPLHWSRLDAFEGDGYRRVAVRVALPEGEGEVEAWIYELADRPS